MEGCPYCGSEDVTYTGMDDGGGDYGDQVCDQFRCNHCDQDFEGDCFGDSGDALDYDIDEPIPYRLVDQEPKIQQPRDDQETENSSDIPW